MKSSASKNTISRPHQSNRLSLILGSAFIGATATYGVMQSHVQETREKHEMVLAGNALSKCATEKKRLKGAQKVFNKTISSLRNEKELDSFDMPTAPLECSAPELDLNKQEAEGIIHKIGITDEADQKAIIDAYARGCTFSSIEDSTMYLAGVSECSSLELNEKPSKNYVLDHYLNNASPNAKVSWEHYQDGDYEAAIDAYSEVIKEVNEQLDPYTLDILEDNPAFTKAYEDIKEIHREAKKGNFYAAHCLAVTINMDFEWPFSWPNEDVGNLHGNFKLLFDILGKMYDQKYPNSNVPHWENDDFVDNCQAAGFDIESPEE